MIEISQGEFENRVQELIDGTTSSKTKLAKELKTDIRTLENKIQELAAYNPELYYDYIKKFEFKQKSREDIDFEALIIEIIKNDMKTEEAVEKYGVGERTIRRHAKMLEKENPELIALYRIVKAHKKNNNELTLRQEEQIKQLVERDVKIGEINEQRKAYLENMERTFNSRMSIVGKEEAAKSMGTTANRMYKMLNELYRIRIEENAKKQNNSFKDGLRLDSKERILPDNDISYINKENIKEKIEGEEK